MIHRLLLIVFLLNITLYAQAQTQNGRVLVDSIDSEHLENSFGENPVREVAVYLLLTTKVIRAILSSIFCMALWAIIKCLSPWPKY